MTHPNQIQACLTHSPEPWDCGGQTTLYAASDETDEITMIELRANVTEASWDTVAFVEAIWPGAEANARRICAAVNACQGIHTEALEQGVIRVLREALDYLLEQTVDMDRKYGIGLTEGEKDARKKALSAIAKVADLPADQRKPIVIEVSGGVVQDVLNVPPGYQYEIKDYDRLEASEGDASQQQSPLDKWLEKCDMPQEAGMREPTNRDRARWARDALAVFTDETFCGDYPDAMHRDDLECAIGDLICDVLHLAHQKGFDPQAILEQGNAHFKTELLEDE